MSEEDDKLTAGPIPVPVKVTVWGLFDALSAIVRAPLRVPAFLGVKVTLMVQEPVAATLLPQVLV